MAGWMVTLLIFLVTYRVTRLIIEDTFPPIGVPREKIMAYWEAHWGSLGHTLHYLFSCPWCMSVWVGAGVVYVFTIFVSVPLPYGVWIASSAMTGILSSLEDKLSEE